MKENEVGRKETKWDEWKRSKMNGNEVRQKK
jgi:hypothetical protein